MRLLFVVSRARETGTVFKLAEKMGSGGRRIIFLFVGDGSHCAKDPELVEHLRFAEGIYVLCDDVPEGLPSDFVEGVEPTDYGGWVELLEACDRVVSWN